MPKEDLSAAIAALERRLADHERKGNEIRRAINVLCEEGGQSPKYADVDTGPGGQGSGTVLTQIKRDSFYGKKQMTAIREYLELRRAQGDGPATPQEILEALKAGGYKFEAKSDVIALVSLRALLRKATTVFHKLPGTRTYGLLSWYPNAKTAKSSDDDDEGSQTGDRRRKAGKVRRKRERIAVPVLAIAAQNGDSSQAA